MFRRSTLPAAFMPARALTACVAALALMLVLCATALAATHRVSQTARADGVEATFTFTVRTSGNAPPAYARERLAIVRNGRTYTQALLDANCPDCAPAEPERGGHSVRVLDIDGSGEPVAIVTLYTGGAHCCTVAEVFSYDPGTGGYVEADHNFADPAYRLERLTPGGDYRFVSADGRFEYAFTDYAASGAPLQIWAFQNGAFTDVTRSYPALVIRDAARWLKAFNRARRDAGGFLAAWAADEELLGHDALVQAKLRSALKAGHLRGNLVANGRRYIRLLNRFLRRTGY